LYLLEDAFGDMRTVTGVTGAEDMTGVKVMTMTGVKDMTRAEDMMREDKACVSRKLVKP
jgi:hypothetical protein